MLHPGGMVMVQVWSTLPLNEVFSFTTPFSPLLEQHSSAFVFWNISI